MTPDALLLKYFAGITESNLALTYGCIMGFQLALGLAQHEPAFMAEMARQLVMPEDAPSPETAAEFRKFVEAHL